MSEPIVETVEVNPPAQQGEGISEEELEGIVGRVVDAKLVPLQESINAIQPLDVDTLRSGILEDITSALSGHSGSSIDEGKLTQTIGRLLDDKLKGIGGGNVTRRAGPISRWLGLA